MIRAQRVARDRTLALAIMLATLVMAVSLLAASPAHAKTFTVNSTSDSDDGKCDPLGLFTDCTLREAINVARINGNAPVVDTISFNIPGPGVKTIFLTSALPDLIEPVTIDGYTQPGADVNTATTGTNADLKIVLDGSGAGSVSGLALKAPNSTVKGLVINDFVKAGILCSSTTTGSRVRGNFIGTDASGTSDLVGSNGYGVWIEGNNNLIGGDVPAARNIISNNANHGVVLGIFGTPSGNKVQGNLIGTAKNGTGDLGNGPHGVAIFSGNNNLVGGAPGAANTIAHNGLDGVNVASGTGNRILSNSIHSNGELGIDLFGGTEDPPPVIGITLNDLKDKDSGPNGLQNYPVVEEAIDIPNGTKIVGTLNSRPEKTYNIQVFWNDVGDPDGFGEGQTFLGQKKVTTNKNGNASFSITTTLPDTDDRISATATGGGGTSEFALWINQ